MIFRLMTLLIPLGITSAVPAYQIPPSVLPLIHARDGLQRRLLQRDEEAVSALFQGKDPVAIHADQTGLQEQIDVLQMRLESLAVRQDFTIPPLPSRVQVATSLLPPRHLEVGRSRTRSAMIVRCTEATHEVVDELNFAAFLDF